MSAQENKAVIRRLVKEVYNEDNLDVVDELMEPDVFDHAAVPEHQHGIDAFKHVIEWVRDLSSDIHYDIDDVIAEGDKVAVRMTVSGTDRGTLSGIPHWQEFLGRLRPLVPSCGRKGGGDVGREGRFGSYRDAAASLYV